MEIVRLETHAHGSGPYILPDRGEVDPGPSDSGQPNRPGPWEDHGIKGKWVAMPGAKKQEYFFGFRDGKQLLDWWSFDHLQSMLDAGMQVSVYEIPEEWVLVGVFQVAFELGRATFLGTVRLKNE